MTCVSASGSSESFFRLRFDGGTSVSSPSSWFQVVMSASFRRSSCASAWAVFFSSSNWRATCRGNDHEQMCVAIVNQLTVTNLEGVVVTLKVTMGEGDRSSGWWRTCWEEEGIWGMMHDKVKRRVILLNKSGKMNHHWRLPDIHMWISNVIWLHCNYNYHSNSISDEL